MSLDSLCRWEVQISVYCVGGYLRILREPSIQCCFTFRFLFPTVYLSVADIENPACYRVVVGPSDFMRSSASHPAGVHGRLAQKRVNRVPISRGGRFPYNLHSNLPMPLS